MKRNYTMKWVIGVLFGLLTLTAAAASVAPTSPRDMVIDTSQKMLAALKKDKQLLKQNPQRIYELVSEIVLPHFDFTTMSKWVLGKNWRTLSPDQQKRFTTEFRTLLVRTYAVSLSEYQDQKLNYLPLQAAPGVDDVTVRTEVLRGGGPAIPINYSMHHTAEWLEGLRRGDRRGQSGGQLPYFIRDSDPPGRRRQADRGAWSRVISVPERE